MYVNEDSYMCVYVGICTYICEKVYIYIHIICM